MLQSHEKSTTWGSGLEELNQGFLTFTLTPYLTQWQQQIQWKLLFNDTEYFAEFLTQAFLKANTEKRWKAYISGLQNGVLSSNDVRELENMNPIDADLGGDDYRVQFTLRIPENLAKIKRIEKIYKNDVADTPPLLFEVLREQQQRLLDAQGAFGDYVSPDALARKVK